jgi:hypothetical protein
MNFDCDISALQEEFTRVTVDKKPGAPRKTGTFLDKIVKMPKGSGYVTLRLLPPLTGYKLPYAACRVHNLASLEDREQKPPKANNLYCGRQLQNRKWVGDCFLCEYYNHLYRLSDKAKGEGNEDLVKQLVAKAKAIKPQEKYYYNAIVLDSNPPTGQSPEDGPLIFSCGIQIHTRILEAVLGNKDMNKKPKGNVFHPVNGRNLKVVKEMKPGGQFPDYAGSEWEDPCPLSEDDALIQKWLGSLNNVHELRKVLTVVDMKHAIRVFEGIEVDARKGFDDSFLGADESSASESSVPEVHHVHQTPAVIKETPVAPHVSLDVDIDDDESPVDDEFAKSVRAALIRDGGIE